jgi:hypothetical protein
MPHPCCEFPAESVWLREHRSTSDAWRRAHAHHHREFVEAPATSRLPEVDFERQVIRRLEWRMARAEELLEVLGLTVPPTCEADALIRSSIPTQEPQ